MAYGAKQRRMDGVEGGIRGRSLELRGRVFPAPPSAQRSGRNRDRTGAVRPIIESTTFRWMTSSIYRIPLPQLRKEEVLHADGVTAIAKAAARSKIPKRDSNCAGCTSFISSARPRSLGTPPRCWRLWSGRYHVSNEVEGPRSRGGGACLVFVKGRIQRCARNNETESDAPADRRLRVGTISAPEARAPPET